MPADKRKSVTRRAVSSADGQGKRGSSSVAAGAHTDHPVTLRLAEQLVDRVDELIPYVADDLEFAALGRVSRSQVLRIAVLHGLKVLQRRYGIDGSDRDTAKDRL